MRQEEGSPIPYFIVLALALVMLTLVVSLGHCEQGPYRVTGSTATEMHGDYIIINQRKVGTMDCTGTQEECEDWAYSLNHARELREEEQQPVIHGPEAPPCNTYGPNGCEDRP